MFKKEEEVRGRNRGEGREESDEEGGLQKKKEEQEVIEKEGGKEEKEGEDQGIEISYLFKFRQKNERF